MELTGDIRRAAETTLGKRLSDDEPAEARAARLDALGRGDIAGMLRGLAEVAAYHGAEGDDWEVWRGVATEAGLPEQGLPALQTAQQRRWLAVWCFNHGTPSLGIDAYARFLTDTEGFAPNQFENQYFFHALLEANRDADVATACALMAERWGLSRVDRAYLAAAKLRCGDPSAERELRALEGVMDGPHIVAAVAFAWSFADRGDDAVRVLRSLSRDSALSPLLHALLLRTFGHDFTHAMSQPPREHPFAPQSAISLVVRRARKSSPHCFGSRSSASRPACRGCGHALICWFSLDIVQTKNLKTALPGWGLFEALACLDCNAWMFRHDYACPAGGSVQLERVAMDQTAVFGTAFERMTPTDLQDVRLERMDARIADDPLAPVCQVGGRPLFIQGVQRVVCWRCDEPMVFVLRFHQTDELEACPAVAGGSGALYFFACNACRTASTIAQWT